MSAPTPLLRVRDVTFGYTPGQPIVQNVTADLMPGTVTALIGPNAAGKSTLLKLLLGQARPWAGSVTLDGPPERDVATLPIAERARVISYVPQRGGVSFAFTVGQVVEMGRFALTRDPAAVEAALAACDLWSLRDRVYAELSVGQQQRVLLARALAQAAGGGRVMLLDEPGSAMDLFHVHETMRVVASLTRGGPLERRMAVLVVLHDLNLAARYADAVWLLDGGRLVRQGPWQEVLTPDVLEPIYRVRLDAVSRDPIQRPAFLVEP